MSAAGPFDPWSRRLAVYGYLAPLVSGKRVLEIGCGEGVGAARLADLGAQSVVGADTDQQALARARSDHRATNLGFAGLDRRSLGPAAPFDLIVVPEAASLLRPGSALNPTAARGLLGAGGRLVVMVSNADRPGTTADGARGYYEVVEALDRLFPKVRMFGVTPFAAYGLAEFAENVAGLRIDGGLVEDASLQPSHYLAVAGPDDDADLGYALVQVPFGAGDIEGVGAAATVTTGGALSAADSEDIRELRRQLAEAQGQNEGVLRVSRAQTEEIEELRGRLRRGAEARAELDQEVTRLRRALAEADESVLDLTRRTREEMAALAQRITSGLRPETGPRGEDQLTIAARESSLSERDERIAALEADKQDLMWRLDALSAQLAESAGRAARTPAPAPAAAAPARASARPAGESPERNQALEQYRQAAAVHLSEVNRLRAALAEQSTQVSELEDALASSEERLAAAVSEAAGLRRHLAEVEEADRGRRSRLAEVEGKMLRLERQAAVAASQAAQAPQESGGRDAGSYEALEHRLRQSETSRLETERRWQDAVERMSSLERAMNEQAAVSAANAASVATAAVTAEAESALRELARLREAYDRSEEQLWETKGQLLLDRERMAVLEHQVATAVSAAPEPTPPSPPAEPTVSEAAHQAIMGSVLKELVEIEASVRQEVTRLDSIERMIEGWRADLAVTDGDVDVSFTRVD